MKNIKKIILIVAGVLFIAFAFTNIINANITTGLIGHWAFEEGSGTTAIDSTGTNNGNIVNGAVWVEGKIGQALSFYGIDDYIDMGSDASIIPSAWTVAGWVRLDPGNTGKQTFVTFSRTEQQPIMYLNHGNSNPFLYLGSNNYQLFDSSATTLLKDGTWHHVAISITGNGQFDIDNAQMYVDGVVIGKGSKSKSNVQSTKDGVLFGRVKTDTLSNKFVGQLDDLRMYNRVLTPLEIQELYNLGSSGTVPSYQCSDGLDNDGDELIDYGTGATNDPGCTSATDNNETNQVGGDTTAPSLSNGKPSGTLPSGTTSRTLSLSTNENAICKFSKTANTNYTAMSSTFTTTGASSHSTNISGLQDGVSYKYYIRCSDTAGNSTTTDYPVSFSVNGQSSTCSSFSYSNWGTCKSNSRQTRTVSSSAPSGCTGGNPILSQSCVYTPLSIEPGSFLQAIADGEADPVLVNGKEWTFRTPPPPVNQRTVRSDHPRLLLTTDNLPALRVKLQDSVYSSYMTKITSRANSGSMLENAFLYQITGNVTHANTAKQALLNYSSPGDYGKKLMLGYDRMAEKLAPILVMDWIMDTLTPSEKVQIFANVKDNFNYDHKTANPSHPDAPGIENFPWYYNDVYNRLPELYLPALAFAIAGDGIDDAWAEEVIAWAYDEEETRVVGPYGPNRGSGFLDVLMTISLDSGGTSSLNQYYSYWLEVLHAIAFWETATGQPMWNRIPFMTEGPQSLLTSRDGVSPSSRIKSVIEFMTGITTGDKASLAKYTTEYFGASTYHTVYRAIFGDMRVTAKTPAQLNIPTARYLRGDQLFYSKDSWDDDAVTLYVRSPYLNIGRGPGSDGVFAIDIGKKLPLSPRVEISKKDEIAGYSSGMWIYDPTDSTILASSISMQNSGTNWGWKDGRAYNAWTAVSKEGYFKFDGGPKSVEITNDYRAISMEYGQRYQRFTVDKAQRTMVHIPDGERNFIVIYDYIDVPSNLKTAWQMRLMEEPNVIGGEFSIPGKLNATVVSPQNHTLEWLGGFEKEFVSPSPEQIWYTTKRGGSIPGYSVNKPQIIYDQSFGLGNIYIQPQGQKNSSTGPFVAKSEFLVVLEVGSQTPVAVNRISDREVRFGNWQVLFNKDGTYTVTDATGNPFVDSTAPITISAPQGGTYNTARNIYLSANETATTYYTTNGSLPTTSSAVYSSPILISTNTTLRFFSVDNKGNTEQVKTETYVIDTSTPTSTKFSLNDKVKVTTTNLNIRNIAGTSGTLLGTQSKGNTGTITNGPIFVNGYHWWQVSYGNMTGWSVEDWLEVDSTSTCTTFTYSNWGVCQSNNRQTRVITNSLPNGCDGGSPALTRSCTYTPSDITPPVISTQGVTTTTNSTTISFTTNERATAYINYGLTSQYGTKSTVKSGTAHSITLSELSGNTTYNYRITVVDSSGNQARSINYTFKTQATQTTDNIAPARTINLEALDITQTSVNLMAWLAPGDDGKTGTASMYDIRYSTSLINNSNWANTTQATGEPNPSVAGTTENYTLVGLIPGTTYYTALKTHDEVPNISPLSNVVTFTTLMPLCIDTDWSYSDSACKSSNTLKRVWTRTNQSCKNGTSKPEEETLSCVYSSTSGGGGSAPAQSSGGSSAVIIDTTAPKQVLDTSIVAADKQIVIKWSNPTDSDYVRTVIIRKEGSSPSSRTDGVIVYEGTSEEYVDTSLDNEKIYYYAIYAYDRTPNYSNPIKLNSKPKAGVLSVQTQNIVTQNQNTNNSTNNSVNSSVHSKQLMLKGPFSVGMDNEQVKLLQQYLAQDKSIYPEGITSGYYGKLTKKAVQRFQVKYGIVFSGTPGTTGYGLAGPKTRIKIQQILGNFNESNNLPQSQIQKNYPIQRKTSLTQPQANSIIMLLEAFGVSKEMVNKVKELL